MQIGRSKKPLPPSREKEHIHLHRVSRPIPNWQSCSLSSPLCKLLLFKYVLVDVDPARFLDLASAEWNGLQRGTLEKGHLDVTVKDVLAQESALPLDAIKGGVPSHRLADSRKVAHDKGGRGGSQCRFSNLAWPRCKSAWRHRHRTSLSVGFLLRGGVAGPFRRPVSGNGALDSLAIASYQIVIRSQNYRERLSPFCALLHRLARILSKGEGWTAN